MIEEIPNPSKEGPKIMVYTVLVGLSTGFVFLMVLLFVAGPDVEGVVSSSAGPVLQIFFNATNSLAGSACLLMYVSSFYSLATKTHSPKGSPSSASSSPQQP